MLMQAIGQVVSGACPISKSPGRLARATPRYSDAGLGSLVREFLFEGCLIIRLLIGCLQGTHTALPQACLEAIRVASRIPDKACVSTVIIAYLFSLFVIVDVIIVMVVAAQ